ncbi:MAG: sulfurtransferase TusA family protein [Pseudomonadales bacterium]|nr:sulfurtransferase TusA family protein [Pseudomonadales bacterium]
MGNDITVDEKLDACGLNCPLPLLKAKQALNGMEPGLVLEVVCTDPGSVKDFDVFSKQSGHEILKSLEDDGKYYYWLKKNQP